MINCLPHKHRLEEFKNSAEKAGFLKGEIKTHRCVAGKQWGNKQLQRLVTTGILSPTAELTPIEVAISLSHYECLRGFVTGTSKETCVVFEDDVIFRKGAAEFVRAASKNVDFSILHLVNANWGRTKGKSQFYQTFLGIRLFREVPGENGYYNAGAAAYMIKRSFANVLLKKWFPITMPVDIFYGSTNLRQKKHIYVETFRDRNGDYTFNSLLHIPVGGGAGSTQDYEDETVDKRQLRRSRTKVKRDGSKLHSTPWSTKSLRAVTIERL